MATTQGNFKKTVSKKFHEFQKNGLEKYSKYLDQQLKIASKSESKVAYKLYIEKEIINTNKKLETLKNKLKAKRLLILKIQVFKSQTLIV